MSLRISIRFDGRCSVHPLIEKLCKLVVSPLALPLGKTNDYNDHCGHMEGGDHEHAYLDSCRSQGEIQ